jgi:hypothetical protein
VPGFFHSSVESIDADADADADADEPADRFHPELKAQALLQWVSA